MIKERRRLHMFVYTLIYFGLTSFQANRGDPARRKYLSSKGMASVGFKTMAATSSSTATDWSHVRVAQAGPWLSFL